MSDFDLMLIHEYQKRPCLYDQTSPYYKDRLYTEQAWQEISVVLNCNLPMMKIRMVQLRCRYNNEKRKFDQIKTANPNATLSWRLFGPLQFLDDHIKPRKSYNINKSLSESTNHTPPPVFPKRRGRPPKNISYAETPDYVEPIVEQKSYHEDYRNQEIKEEEDSHSSNDNTTAAEAEAETEVNDDAYVNSISYLAQTTQSYANPDSASDPAKEVPQVPRTNGFVDAPHLKRKRRRLNNTNNMANHSTPIHHVNPYEAFYRQPDKFMAFGHFVSATLSEITEEKALNIVESFTASLVEAMREKQ